MAEEMTLSVEQRDDSGTAAVRRLRRKGFVPGVVYSDGKDATAIQLERHTFEQMLRHHASEHVVLDLAMPGGAANKVLLKEVQHHPLTGTVMHVDFLEIAMDQVLRVSIAVSLVGEAIGVTRDGGVLEQHLREVEVECLPGDMAESFEYDVSEMAISDSLSVADLGLDPDKFRVITDGDIAVANVVAPRVATADEEGEGEEGDELAAEAGAAEPEVITEKKQDGDASGN
jgi:large subunit ribosomal protein L25